MGALPMSHIFRNGKVVQIRNVRQRQDALEWASQSAARSEMSPPEAAQR